MIDPAWDVPAKLDGLPVRHWKRRTGFTECGTVALMIERWLRLAWNQQQGCSLGWGPDASGNQGSWQANGIGAFARRRVGFRRKCWPCDPARRRATTSRACWPSLPIAKSQVRAFIELLPRPTADIEITESNEAIGTIRGSCGHIIREIGTRTSQERC